MSGERLDRFYTRPDVAKQCVEWLARVVNFGLVGPFVEPSAGAGAFLGPLRAAGAQVTAYDLAPAPGVRGIEKADFFELDGFEDGTVFVGNPPFGHAASLAVRFFNHAAQWADVIAFVLPRTFRKVSVQDRLDAHFWLEADHDLPKTAFVRHGEPWDVPCVFQVWRHRARHRARRRTPDVSRLLAYVRSDERHDVVIRRVGGRAGQLFAPEPGGHSASSNYFVRLLDARVEPVLAWTDWSGVRDATAGVRSVSKREIAQVLDEALGGG